MTVDFKFRKSPAYRVATLSWRGAWSERAIERRSLELERWTREHRLRAGKWMFLEPGENRWTAAIEVRGKARGDGKVRLRTFPASRVASVTFDPEEISARVIYHGLNDWLRWRRKAKEIRRVTGSRELYDGNPWRDRKAWARTEVQYLVRP